MTLRYIGHSSRTLVLAVASGEIFGVSTTRLGTTVSCWLGMTHPPSAPSAVMTRSDVLNRRVRVMTPPKKGRAPL